MVLKLNVLFVKILGNIITIIVIIIVMMQHNLRWKQTILFQIKQHVSSKIILGGLLPVSQNLYYVYVHFFLNLELFSISPHPKLHMTLKIKASQALHPVFSSVFLPHNLLGSKYVSMTQAGYILLYNHGKPHQQDSSLPGFVSPSLCWKELVGFIQKISLPDVGQEAVVTCGCGGSLFEIHIGWSRPINILQPVAFTWAG